MTLQNDRGSAQYARLVSYRLRFVLGRVDTGGNGAQDQSVFTIVWGDPDRLPPFHRLPVCTLWRVMTPRFNSIL